MAEGKDIKTQKVREIMTSNPVVGDENIDVDDAARIMSERQIRRLPIAANNTISWNGFTWRFSSRTKSKRRGYRSIK